MIQFRNWSVGNRLFLIVFIIVGTVFFAFEFALGKSTMNITEKHVFSAERNQVKIVVDLIEVFEQSKRDEVARFSRLFSSYFKQAITADTKNASQVGGRSVPTLKLNGKSLHFDHSIPDRFTAQSSEVATIFAKAGDDFVRIATSLKKQNGERAVGTWLKRSHPSYHLLLSGKKYAGLATLFDTQYMTEYLPIFDARGEVIGVKFVGVDVTHDVAALKSKLGSIRIGETGHLYVVNTKKGADLGKLVFHPTAEGKNVLDARDAYGHAYMKTMLAARSGTAHLELRNPDSTVSSMLVAYEHLKDRNWLIVAQVPEDEMTGDIVTMRNLYSIIGVFAMLLIAGILYFIMRRMVSAPLKRAARTADLLSEGVLPVQGEEAVEEKHSGADELDRMMAAVMNMAKDISERKVAEKALRLTQFSVNQAAFPIFWITADARIHYANQAARQILGYSKDELLLLCFPDLSPEFSQESWDRHWHSLKENESLYFESILKTRDEKVISVEISANYLEYEGQEFNCAFIRDITEKKKSEEVIWHQANFDSLTGLPNRRMFIDRLGQRIKHAERTTLPMALLFVDLDDFKNVNDMFGHDAGDGLLREASQRLEDCVRESDTLARLGGDEFTVIMGDLQDRSAVDLVCQRILEKISEPFSLGEEVVYISASVGVTLYPQDARTSEDLLINADQAMYAAKQQGRHRYNYFTQSMQAEAQYRKRLIQDLRTALDEQQFVVLYQPIVDLATGEITKAEALVRWQHPRRGTINPNEFIPVAEETGLIHELGGFVFQTVANQVAVWREAYRSDFQVSVNMSPVQFRNHEKNSQAWLDYLKFSQLDGASVVAEITEGLLLDASHDVMEQLLAFRDAGVQVAIDDFGTGYSSLSYLKKFDIDYIKIDRNFVTGLAPGAEDLALCEAIIVMAHKLGLEVIAEGVETQAQSSLLADAGCNFAQGFLFSKALPSDLFEQMLEDAVARAMA